MVIWAILSLLITHVWPRQVGASEDCIIKHSISTVQFSYCFLDVSVCFHIYVIEQRTFNPVWEQDALLYTMHYVGVSVRLRAQASHPPPNTCVWRLGINFSSLHLVLPWVCTHREAYKSCKNAALGFAAGARLIHTPLRCPISRALFLCFFHLPLHLPPSLLVKGKRWHLSCCQACTVMGRGVWGVWDTERARQTPPSSPYIYPLACALSSVWPLCLCIFYLEYPFFLGSFLLISACPSL